MTNPTLITEARTLLATTDDRLKAVLAKLDAICAAAEDPTTVRAVVHAANELVGEAQDAIANLMTAVEFTANDPFSAVGADPNTVHIPSGFPCGGLEEGEVVMAELDVEGPLPEEDDALRAALEGKGPMDKIEAIIPRVTRAIPCHVLKEPPPLPKNKEVAVEVEAEEEEESQLELPLYDLAFHEHVVGAQIAN